MAQGLLWLGKAVGLFTEQDPEVLQHFIEVLLAEAKLIAPDRCTVCHKNLHGYEDDRCKLCGNISICSSCVQAPDPGQYTRTFTIGRKTHEEPFVLSASDVVCLQCGLYSSYDQEMVRKHEVFRKSCMAYDALLERERDYGLRTLAFVGWSLCRRLKTTWKLDTQLSQFLTYAESARLQLAKFSLKRPTVGSTTPA